MEAGPFGRPLQFRDIPGPHFVGSDRQELGLGVDRMDSLAPALAGLALGGQEPIHGTDRAVIAAFIEQCGEHRGRRHVREALAVEKAQQQIAVSPVALRAPSATASEEEPNDPFIEDFSNEVMCMSYLYSKLPETGVSTHTVSYTHLRAHETDSYLV